VASRVDVLVVDDAVSALPVANRIERAQSSLTLIGPQGAAITATASASAFRACGMRNRFGDNSA
jgi:hypothetical protein